MAANTFSWREVPALPGRSLRTVFGAWVLVWDGVAEIVRDPALAIERVQLRGVRAHRQLRRSLRDAEYEAEQSAQRLAASAIEPMRRLQTRFSDSGRVAEDEVERQVQIILERLGIPNRTRIERLSHEIEQLSARIDLELQRLERSKS